MRRTAAFDEFPAGDEIIEGQSRYLRRSIGREKCRSEDRGKSSALSLAYLAVQTERRRSRALLDLEEHRGFDPQIFEPVEFSLLAREEMNDDIAVVDQYPPALGLALDAVWANSTFSHLADNLALECSKLSYVIGSRYDKHIGE